MTDLPALREAVAKMTPGPWGVDARFGLDIVRAEDIGQPHGGGVTPELDARYCWVIANVRAHNPFDGCEAFTRRKFKGQQEPEADAAGIVALRNALPALLDELAAARAVLDDAEPLHEGATQSYQPILVDRVAWQAWQEKCS
jgi:hypothetical protein